MKRGGPLKRTPRKRLDAEDKAAADSFKEEARYQAVCAVCGRAGSFDAHHVVERQWLSQHGKPEWDARNAMRLCDRWTESRCHERHTSGSWKIALTCLSDGHYDYAYEVMGPAAYDYLGRHYAGEDPRRDQLLEREK